MTRHISEMSKLLKMSRTVIIFCREGGGGFLDPKATDGASDGLKTSFVWDKFWMDE